MDVAKAVERDLKRFDDLTTRFETSGLVLGFVNLFIAVWVRAPGLEMNPGSGFGLPMTGFNVGYAIVFAPLVSFMTMLFYLSILSRRDALRAAILAQASSTGTYVLSEGESLALGVTDADGRPAKPPLADRAWRALWYFVVPPAAAIVATARYFDFVVDEKSSTTLGERMRHLLLEGGGASVRPILHDHAVEDGKAHLPYINPPVTSWIEIALVVAALLMAWRASRLYRARPVGDVTGIDAAPTEEFD